MEGLLRHVPPSLADQVRLIDLADDRGAPGINLVDTRIFSDRDRTADSVVRVAKGLWEQWGPRMQSILEQTVKTLHEANEHPSTSDDEQYTVLDGLKLLSDARFRGRALKKVTDPYLLEWWARDFRSWHRQYKAEALAPVQTRLSYYASSKRARAILGQSRSTIDMRQVILDGGVLLVSTSQGTAGRDVAALVGASMLNLVDAVIREQGNISLERRRGVLVVVDEMQSMPGVDYEGMLGELGKFGASFVLATQSLAKLSDLSRTMQDTLLANIGCLAVFQVAGADARTLTWELGKDRVSEDDITSLPVHHCYVRATVGKERMPRPPTPPRPKRSPTATSRRSGWLRSTGRRWRPLSKRRRADRLHRATAPLPKPRSPTPSLPSGATSAPGRARTTAMPKGIRRMSSLRSRTNETHREQARTSGLSGIHAFPRPAGAGRPLRLVQGRGLRGRPRASSRGAGSLGFPCDRPHPANTTVLPHIRRTGAAGP